MKKQIVHLVFAIASFAVSVILNLNGIDASLIAAGAAGIFALLSGYNTYNPNLSREATTSQPDSECPASKNYSECCKDIDGCKFLGGDEDEA